MYHREPPKVSFPFQLQRLAALGTESGVLTAASPDVQAPTCSHICISVSPPSIPSCLHTCPSPQNIPPSGQPRPLSTSPAPKRNLQVLGTYPMKNLGAFLLFFPRETERESNPTSQSVHRRRLLILQAAMLHMYVQTRGAPKFPFSRAPHPPSAWLNTPTLCRLMQPTQQGDL